MRKVNRTKDLMIYLDSVNYPMTEEKINDLIFRKKIPHSRPMSSIVIFDLDHIDWWINEQRKKT
ncbi:hypothetical protein F9802_03010 [Bacillus aerolatus]|uniref:DNA-binding protein n=1 Tax=Bacillus aerolatus TaxID=2653354 RepID=A0A6I1G0E8_9BACI|nr:hypothetical protein [Bacillus aerolatus]KAB7709096.1 hypothetical protein F9802_03010 [Bacillus aerolatus]